MTASAAIAIADGSGGSQDQGQGYEQQLTPGDVATFSLQSSAGIQPNLRWDLSFASPDTPTLNGLAFEWPNPSAPTLPAAFAFKLPPAGFTARYITSILDHQNNVISQFTGTIFGTGGGGGGGTAECSGFTMPAAPTPQSAGGTASTTLSTSLNFQVGQTAAVQSGGYLLVTAVSPDGLTVTLQNTGAAVNAAAGTVIANGAIVSVAGQDSGTSAATAEGQVQAKAGGVYSPAGLSPVRNTRARGTRNDGHTNCWLGIQESVQVVDASNATVKLVPGQETYGSDQGIFLIHQPVFLYNQQSNLTQNFRLAGMSCVNQYQNNSVLKRPHNNETAGIVTYTGGSATIAGDANCHFTKSAYPGQVFNVRGLPMQVDHIVDDQHVVMTTTYAGTPGGGNPDPTLDVWDGPNSVMGGVTADLTYTSRSGLWWVTFHNPVPASLESQHYFNLTEHPTCTLSGRTTFTAEAWINLPSNPHAGYQQVIYSSIYNNVTLPSRQHQALDIGITNNGGTLRWYMYVTTSGSNVVTAISDGNPGTSNGSSAGTTSAVVPSLNTDYFVAFSIGDGFAHLLVGTTQGGALTEIMKVPATGSIVQTFYEQFTVGIQPYVHIPATGAIGFPGSGNGNVDGVQFASLRLSDSQRYTGTSTVPTGELTVGTDNHCMMLLSFVPLNRSANRTATTLQAQGYYGYIIGQASTQYDRSRYPWGNDVWVKVHGAFNGTSALNCVEDVGFVGGGLFVMASQYTRVKRCAFSFTDATNVYWTAFSYGSSTYDCQFAVNNWDQWGGIGINANIVVANTEMVYDDGFSHYFGGQWAIIVGGGAASSFSLLNAYVSPSTAARHGTLWATSSITQISLENCHLYDESTQNDAEACILLTQVTNFRASNTQMATGSGDTAFKFDFGNGTGIDGGSYRIHGQISGYGLVFATDGGSNSTAVACEFDFGAISPFSATAPVYVKHPVKEESSVTVTLGSTSQSMTWAQFQYGTWHLVDGVGLGGAATLTVPVVAGALVGSAGQSGGYRRSVHNTMGQDCNIGAGLTQNYVGTVAVTGSNTAMTGTGTAFKRNNWNGQVLRVNGTSCTIATVNSDTSITLTAGFGGATASGATLFQTGKVATVTAGKRQLIETVNGNDWYPIGAAI